jgi:hypothetical protein
MHPLVMLSRRLAEQFRHPHAEDLREPMHQRKRRRLQTALDLRQVVFGDHGQPGDDSLGLAFCHPVQPKPFAYPYFGLGGHQSSGCRRGHSQCRGKTEGSGLRKKEHGTEQTA